MTTGHGEKLSRKMETAIAALLLKPTLQTAAQEVGISETTLWRWLQQPDFQKSYRQARRQVVEGATARLQQATGAAVEALERNLKCGEPSAEIAAAREIIRQAVQAVEVWELIERLEELELLVRDSNALSVRGDRRA